MDAQGSISRVLDELERGEAAASALLPLVYDELRRLAAVRLSRLPPGQTLQPTALVHEAFIELVGRGDPGWSGRGHFFGAAARAMHDILVDHARRKAALKRGGNLERASFDESAVGRALSPELTDVIAVSNALARLRADHPRPASVAMLKTFAGAEDADIAVHHGVTTRTVERDWRFARAYLLRELSR